jgi:threonylcarbamoyladenosine tRNA methylthiotransferase MtaB
MKVPTKFSIKTLGCKVNQYEEQVIREKVLDMGYVETDPKDADIFILNSCTVTGEADRKTLQLIRRVKRDNPGVRVVVTGCYAVVEKDIETLRAMPEVDMVVPGKDKTRIKEFLGCLEDNARVGVFDQGISGFSGHSRAFVKVQDGCDQRCSYCKVNIVRGPSVSRPYEDIMAEVKTLISKGYREVVLTGICIGAWKVPGHSSIAALIDNVCRIDGNFRVRVSSIEPNHIDERFIKTVSSSKKFCRHIHIPLQSGSDTILEKMKRRYTSTQFKDIVSRLRREMPFLGISTDIIVGFPGERSSDFNATREFVQQIKPSRIHVFPYSDRPGTSASRMEGRVPVQEVKNRVKILLEDGKHLQKMFCKSFIEKDIEVLVEAKSYDGAIEGYTAEYVRVRAHKSHGSYGEILRLKGAFSDPEGCFLIAE